MLSMSELRRSSRLLETDLYDPGVPQLQHGTTTPTSLSERPPTLHNGNRDPAQPRLSRDCGAPSVSWHCGDLLLSPDLHLNRENRSTWPSVPRCPILFDFMTSRRRRASTLTIFT